ncbi:cytochrome c oxidase assembly protein subunit 15 [Sediminihabitans luteus]|uniref:Cytochrome c oxidase assembly protein subunit 15 n=1 Tax=Sediminihabitans luteus TaxID=1138585 RepID=A0A2M9CRB1_9CELL|nr:COX15/CtaA family protein [Sediminihabitans luteus]PJJ74427.1 cytochrome c oxidase assembly protein subunit 15 [Sediminihabitans luteus]GIJ00206.1 protein required for cytochrome oxidase assembly [Sediminihabitans luteus]
MSEPTQTTPPSAAAPPSALGRGLAAARRWTHPVLVANLVAQIGIIVTGGAVRLTGSGLGCSTWPECEPGQFTAKFHAETSYHQYVEFGNRTLTGVLGVIAIAVAILVWSDRTRTRSYRLLGFAPLLGVVAQAVLGGIVVRMHLHPALVSVHFLISGALVALSLYLLHRSGEGDGPPVPTVGPRLHALGTTLVVLMVPVVVLGVIVTGAGPHSGDDEIAYRIAVDPALVTRFHAASVWLFVAVLVATVVVALRTAAPDAVRRSLWILLAITLAQGVVGYVQYFTGLPWVLVGIHMLGAALLVAGAVRVPLTMRTRATTSADPRATDDVTAGVTAG